MRLSRVQSPDPSANEPSVRQPAKQRDVLIACSVMGLAWYVAHGGWATLDPTRTGWLRSEDLSQHFLGWLYFRRMPVTWPIGQLPTIGYPVGTTVGFMDANPLMSSLFKPLAPFLPMYWQFQGWWLASCFTLQGLVGGLLGRLIAPKVLPQLCIAALFVVAPPALLRVCHENLASHWLLLAAIYLNLRPDANPQAARRACGWGGLLLLIALSTHAYMAAMLLPLLVLAVGRRTCIERSLSWKFAACVTLGYAGVTLAILKVFGFIGSGISQSEPGFGSQSADLVTFFNPKGWSRFLPDQYVTPEQFEGYAYLGLGGIILAMVAVCLTPLRGLPSAPKYAWRCVGVLACLYAVLALSDTIALHGTPLYSFRALTVHIWPVISIFRASGRFIWLLYYFLIALGASLTWRCLPAPKNTWALVGILGLQLADINPLDSDVHHKLTRLETTPYVSVAWQAMGSDYAHLDLVPPLFPSSQTACRWTYAWGYQVPFCFLAYEHAMSVNSVYAGRADTAKINTYCQHFWQDLQSFQLNADTVYVVDKAYRHLFADVRMQASCTQVDGVFLCVSARRPTKLLAWILAHPAPEG